jgi:hypothetical protein
VSEQRDKHTVVGLEDLLYFWRNHTIMEYEYEGQFPSKNCGCHIQEPYGFVPEADCKEHDTTQFIKFLNAFSRRERTEEHDKCGIPCGKYSSGHSIDVNGNCNKGCC